MILVTGGTGLIGSHLLFELVKGHEDVVATKRVDSNINKVLDVFKYYSPEAEEYFRLIDWVDADICNYQDLSEIINDVDQVYHCAAMVSFNPRYRRKMIKNNITGTANIVNCCLERGVEKLLHVSSSAAIGPAPTGFQADESMIWSMSKTVSSYSISKFKSEMEVWRGIEEGLTAVIVNPTVVLGPGFWDQSSSQLFSRIDNGLKYFATGVTGFIYVNDVISAIVQLMNSDISGERFILSAENLSYKEVFSMIASALNKPIPIHELSPHTMNLLSFLDQIPGLVTGKRRITKEHARAAFSQNQFSNKKITESIGIEFLPVNEAIQHIAKIYLAEH